MVQHDEESQEEWWKATIEERMTRARNAKFAIYYDGFDEKYECQFSEYRKGDIRLIPVSAVDLVGKKVEILLECGDSGEVWTLCSVISVKEKLADCLEFIVEIDRENGVREESESDDESLDDSQDIFSFPLIDYYLNNTLRFVST